MIKFTKAIKAKNIFLLDDDGSTGAEAISGIVVLTATGGSEATNADAVFSYPTVSTTLA